LLLAPLLLASCEQWDGDRIASLPRERAWQVLPLRRLLTRPTISVDAMEFCRAESCGYDAAVARFTAEAGEAKALRQSITEPAKLAALVREPGPRRSGTQRPDISVENFASGDWTGLSIAIAGARRRAYGVILERPAGERLSIILVFAAKAEVARMLARSAAAS
jgi:hypothetical protein